MGLRALFERLEQIDPRGCGAFAAGGMISQKTRGEELDRLFSDRSAEAVLPRATVQLGRFECVPAEAAAMPAELGADRFCRECGCTFFKPCIDPFHGPCWWVEADLCSLCRDRGPANA